MSPQLIGKPAPELEVAKRVQGEPVNISALKGRVVVVEVFQVNCPGCFVHALPEVVDDAAVNTFIHGQLPDFDSWPGARKQPVYVKARAYLEAETHRAHTFESYGLQGTPSSILVDRLGLLREVAFGYVKPLEPLISDLLQQAIR